MSKVGTAFSRFLNPRGAAASRSARPVAQAPSAEPAWNEQDFENQEAYVPETYSQDTYGQDSYGLDGDVQAPQPSLGYGNDGTNPDPYGYEPESPLDHGPEATPASGRGWLTAIGVKKAFGKRQVVKGVSLAVRQGEAVGLLGPNGAGKTTVFYMVTGLIPADSGSILIDGNDVTSLPMYRRARLGIGYLPQEASIFRGLSVEDNIMAVLELVEPSRQKRKEQLDELLDEFRIGRLRKSPSIALSGGERRRCEIARALASKPSFILLDEPFAGIDPIAVGDIQVLVRHLTDRGIGVLITDHNVRETLNLIDRAYIIYDGTVLMQGSPEEVKTHPEVRARYLGDMKI